MTRRHRLIALVAAGATIVSSCGGAPRREEIAKVDDQVLYATTLESLVSTAAGAESVNGEYPSDLVGGVINLWVWNTAIRAELDDLGVEAPAPKLPESLTVDDLQADVQSAFEALATYETERDWTPEELKARYDSLLCINAATTETEDGARELIDAINGGTGFVDATEVGATTGAPLGCVADADQIVTQLAQAGVAVDPAPLDGIQPGKAVGPWPSEFGFVVLQRSSLDEALESNAQSLKGEGVLIDVVARHDISVNSIYGSFTAEGLRPLGVG